MRPPSCRPRPFRRNPCARGRKARAGHSEERHRMVEARSGHSSTGWRRRLGRGGRSARGEVLEPATARLLGGCRGRAIRRKNRDSRDFFRSVSRAPHRFSAHRAARRAPFPRDGACHESLRPSRGDRPALHSSHSVAASRLARRSYLEAFARVLRRERASRSTDPYRIAGPA